MTERGRQKRIAKIWCFALTLGIWCYDIHGQSPLSQMYHRAWTAREGAPDNIEGVAQGPHGFLWLTTEDGLFKFDGVTFNPYRPPSGTALVSNRMEDVIATKDGSLWVSYTLGGVTRIHENEVTNFGDREGLRGSRYPALAEDLSGAVWVAGTRGLEYIRDSKVYRVEDSGGADRQPNESLVFDRDGNLWINPASGMMVLPRGAKNFLRAPQGDFYGCGPAHGHGVLCRSRKAVLTHFALVGKTITSQPLLQPPSAYWNTLVARDGSIWIATDKNGIERIPSDDPGQIRQHPPEFFGRKDGLSSDRVIKLIQDREGSVWVVTDRGLDQFRPIPFHVVNLDAPVITLPSNAIGEPFLIATDRLAAIEQGIAHYLSAPGPVSGAAGSLFRADDGSIWFGMTDGLYRYWHGRVEQIPVPNKVKHFGWAQLIAEDVDHRMWVSSRRGGLFRLDGQVWTKRGDFSQLPDQAADVALRDRNGALWFGYRRNVLVQISGGKATTFHPGQSIGDVRVLAEQQDRLWIGGEKGVVSLKSSRFDPLVLRGDTRLHDVSGMIFVANGDLWLNSSSGVMRIANSELSRWERDPHYAVAWQSFNYLDGVEGIPTASTGNPSAALASDGKLYLSTNRRLQWIDPLHVGSNPVPPEVWVIDVESEGRSLVPSPSIIRLAPDPKNVVINYTATSLLIPERVRFRYRLRGYEKEWVDAGAHRQAVYAKLPPGDYTFEVQGCNDSGVWAVTPGVAMLRVPPTFLETVWFKVGMFLALIVILLLSFRIRSNAIRRRVAGQMYEILGERQRIARDLHDTLLQSVQALMFKIAVATKRLPQEEPVRPLLEATLAQSDQVLLEGRRLISNLQTSEEATEALLHRLQAIGEELQSAYPSTRFLVDTEGTDRLLSTVVDPELCTIGREALTNAFRHAEAAHVWLTIRATAQELRLDVRDDGCGVAPDVLATGYRSGHWGLRNMKERASRVGGTFKLSSTVGGGTHVAVTVPASVAYKGQPRDWRESFRRLWS